MEHIRFIFRYVLDPKSISRADTAKITEMMKSKDPRKKDEDSKKFTDVKLFAEKFNAYIDSLIEAKN